MAKSIYAVLRMLPGESTFAPAKTGLDNIKDAKAAASELAMENDQIIFIPAVLYEPFYAKKIVSVSHQVTVPPVNSMRLIGFIEPEEGCANADSTAPEGTDGDGGDGDGDTNADGDGDGNTNADGDDSTPVVSADEGSEKVDPDPVEPEKTEEKPAEASAEEQSNASQTSGALF